MAHWSLLMLQWMAPHPGAHGQHRKNLLGLIFFIKDMKFGGRLLGAGLEKFKGKYEC